MRISDLYSKLALKELQGTAYLDESGNLLDSKKDTILAFANDGLDRLFTMFPMKEKKTFIKMNSDINTYKLTIPYTVSARATYPNNPHYIIDNDFAPYTEDLVKITALLDEHGHRITINDMHSLNGITTPFYNTLVIPNPVDDSPLVVFYQALHDRLPSGNPDYVIDIPRTLEEALTAFIGSAVFSALNTEGSQNRAQQLMTYFQMLCSNAGQDDLLSTSSSSTNIKFSNRGFV